MNDAAFGWVRRRLRRVLDAGRRHHVADERFYRLFDDGSDGGRASRADVARGSRSSPGTEGPDARLRRVAPPL